MPWVDDAPNLFAWTGSWETHTPFGEKNRAKFVGDWPPENTDGFDDGYYAIGARCVFP